MIIIAILLGSLQIIIVMMMMMTGSLTLRASSKRKQSGTQGNSLLGKGCTETKETQVTKARLFLYNHYRDGTQLF